MASNKNTQDKAKAQAYKHKIQKHMEIQSKLKYKRKDY